MALSILTHLRFSFWFVSAFIKKYLGFIAIGFIAGLVLSTIVTFLPTISPTQVVARENIIGLVGQYTLATLPRELQSELSFGLTKIGEDGSVFAGAASSWEVKDNGSRYLFHLRRDLTWQDGTKFRSFDINLRLKDVEILARGDYEVEFKLKEPYAALPAIVSQPLFKQSLVGFGPKKAIRIISESGNIKSVEVIDKNDTKTLYKFYKTPQEGVLALKLHELTSLVGLNFLGDLSNWSNLKIEKKTDYQKFVALFFNTRKEPFKEKGIRLGLTYGIADNLSSEEEALGPISKKSWAYNNQLKNFSYNQDLSQKYLKDLLDKTSTTSANFQITLVTMPIFKAVASSIAKSWQDLGIKTLVLENDTYPKDFDVFLGALETMPDPDQYFLWHSLQSGNITGFNSPRIDKLLEDGRKTIEQKERKQKYLDFQRFLVEDDPTAFLFYPSSYTVSRL